MANKVLYTSTPFNFEFIINKSFFSGTTCSIVYNGRKGRDIIYEADKKMHAILTVFNLAKDFEDMVCSLSEEEMEYVDSRQFSQLCNIFQRFYTKYPPNYVDTNSMESYVPHEHLLDYKIGTEVIHGCPRSVKLVGTTLEIEFYLGPSTLQQVHINVPASFSELVKIGLSSSILRRIKSGNRLGLYSFYVSAGWVDILNDVYEHYSNIPEKIKKRIPINSYFFKYWRVEK